MGHTTPSEPEGQSTVASCRVVLRKLQRVSGARPVNMLSSKDKVTSSVSWPSSEGTVPENALPSNNSTFTCVRLPIWGGIAPSNELSHKDRNSEENEGKCRLRSCAAQKIRNMEIRRGKRLTKIRKVPDIFWKRLAKSAPREI